MKKVIVIGSVNIDYTARVQKLPRKGETILAKETSISLGGKGANQAIALHRLGCDTTFIGAIGSDSEAEFARRKLKEYGLRVDNLLVKTGNTGKAFINVSEDGDNTIVVDLGANEKFDARDISNISYLLSGMNYCVLQLELPASTIISVLEICAENDIKTILNPAPAVNLEVLEEHLDKIDLLIPNETELELLSGCKLTSNNVQELCNKVIAKGAKRILVTLGAQGSYYTDGKDNYFASAVKTTVIDPTAAGDSYIGALVSYLSMDREIKEAMDFASIVASITVSRLGAAESIPEKSELK